MNTPHEIGELFRRDLARLAQEAEAFSPEAALWSKVPGIANAPGNLFLHLDGNHREFIGRLLGGVAYTRDRKREFAPEAMPVAELVQRIGELPELIGGIVSSLSDAALREQYPENILGRPATTHQVLVSLHGHLNYHLGQIDYLRRILTGEGALQFAPL